MSLVLNDLNRRAASLRTVTNQQSTGVGGRIGNLPASRINSIFANATGGVYTQPTFGLLGEKMGYGDAVIPFKQSEGIEAAISRLAGTSGTSVNVTMPGMMVGENVSPSDLRKLETFIIDTFKNVVTELR